MALANFFDRAATAASQVLKGFDLAAFERKLGNQLVGVAFTADAAVRPEGWAALELTVNLLARLYPTIAIVGRGVGATRYLERLNAEAHSINPDIEIVETLRRANPIVAFGDVKLPSGAAAFRVGSDGWVARLSTCKAPGIGDSRNPFGAGAAACFAAANVFRHVFAEQLVGAGPDRDLTLSLLTYDQKAPKRRDPELTGVNLGTTELVGIGAIGNGFVWAVQRVPELSGILNLIDHEMVDLSNVQRYVLTTQEHIGRKKSELAAELLARSGCSAVPHVGTWGSYLHKSGHFRSECVAVALDSVRDRIAVQASLPRQLFNAWTQTHDLGVSRHEFLGTDACLACLYLPDKKAPDEDELVAQAFGIPERMEVRRLLYFNSPVSRDFLDRVADARGLPREALLRFENKPVREFYVEAFCGGAVFRLTGGNQTTPTLVPMAFQSALAGVMLAAEIVAHCTGLKAAPPPVTTTINLLRPLAPYVSFPRQKDSGNRCICQDQDYIAAYKTKWAVGSPT